MSRVAIVTSHLQDGDAVSNDVLGMGHAFLKRGFDSRVYSESSDLTDIQTSRVSEIDQFLTNPEDLLLYHYSIGWEPGLRLLRTAKCRTSVKYHNVTPPECFAGISPWHEEKCRAGVEELKEIVRAGCDLYLADSGYNRDDLVAEGLAKKNCFVVPPFHQIDQLQFIEADIATLDAYRDGRTNILMVGRVAPHKGHDALIRAFALYHHDYDPQSRLFIVGKEEAAFEIYSKRLRELANFFAVEEAVHFVGGVSTRELKAYYLLSRVFAIASEHEGFCVPVVEAMSLSVPVLAFASSALTGTVGSAGIVLDERDPRLMAEAIDRLVKDEALNFEFSLMGRKRYEDHFTTQKAEAALFRAVDRL
ncbi:MAG TPA: glycosyltransferase family 4 protein [Pyrinomonadaceae bacterium]